jgi:hypothetical protein
MTEPVGQTAEEKAAAEAYMEQWHKDNPDAHALNSEEEKAAAEAYSKAQETATPNSP